MARPVARITTPYPTPEEEARRLRISKRRQRELSAIAAEYFSQMQREKRVPAGNAIDQGKKRKNAAAA